MLFTFHIHYLPKSSIQHSNAMLPAEAFFLVEELNPQGGSLLALLPARLPDVHTRFPGRPQACRPGELQLEAAWWGRRNATVSPTFFNSIITFFLFFESIYSYVLNGSIQLKLPYLIANVYN